MTHNAKRLEITIVACTHGTNTLDKTKLKHIPAPSTPQLSPFPLLVPLTHTPQPQSPSQPHQVTTSVPIVPME